MSIDYGIILQVAALGFLVAMLYTIFKKNDREEYAYVVMLLGVMVVMFKVINVINELFAAIRTMFRF